MRIEVLGPGGWAPPASFGVRSTGGDGRVEAVVAADPRATYRVAVEEDGRWRTGVPLNGAREAAG